LNAGVAGWDEAIVGHKIKNAINEQQTISSINRQQTTFENRTRGNERKKGSVRIVDLA
jgi:hypothetical protein